MIMGGLPCAKAAIDGPGILGAEAAAASLRYHGAAAEECAALVQTCHGFAMAFPFIYEELDAIDDDAARTDILAGLKLSYKMCDWAKELKAASRATEDLRPGLANLVVGWRTEITTWLTSIEEKYMPEEYRVK
jgi:hypothetical protein